MPRCPWCGDDPIYVAYHDQEWGVPLRDDRALFEKLILDGFQAGLSWITVLRKRDNFISAFDGFEPQIISNYDEAKIQSLMQDAGIIRNQAKIRATVNNAQAYLRIQEEGSFSEYLWAFVGGRPIINKLKDESDYRSTSPESDAMSKGLKSKGFKFVGSTICYAFMQAVGMVNDHLMDCPRWDELRKEYS
ncbi:MAG: DNA-3-methyladenine glycosylase I [Flavobacteriales bacterium]|nr:DNA-3-methyladenine glycosylase I [Flavobacteriales bacterium]